MTGLAWTTDPVLLLLYAAAVARLTRLVVLDVILDRPREWLLGDGHTPSRAPEWLATLLGCPWCVSVWLAAGWAALASLLPTPVAALLAAVLAWSLVAGLAHRE